MRRSNVLDIVKALGIFAVVVGHNRILLEGNHEVFRILFSFHMPLFFFVSGVFLKPSVNTRQFVFSKLDSLLKPYFVVLFLVCTLKLIGLYVSKGHVVLDDFDLYRGVIYATGASISWVPLWFLPHLFVSSLFSLCLVKLLRLNGFSSALVAATSLVSGCWLIGVFTNDINLAEWNLKAKTGLPWSLDLIPLTSAFMLLGYALQERIRGLSFHLDLFMVAAFCFAGLHLMFDETIDLNARHYGHILVATAQALLGIYLCLMFAVLLERSTVLGGWLAYIGSRSLFVLIFHDLVQGKGAVFVFGYTQNQYLGGGVALIMACALPLLIFDVARRNVILSSLLLPANRR